jgi:putative DNA primase/helicase
VARRKGEGTRTTAVAIRTVGDKHGPVVFSTWSPKVFALIGKLRDTAMDRSIVIEMRRRKPEETVAPLRAAVFAAVFAAVCLPLRRRLLRWADDTSEHVPAIEPTFPPGLRDRAQDNWSPLFAIAQLAGTAWVERANRAALLLSGGEESNEDSRRCSCWRIVGPSLTTPVERSSHRPSSSNS